MIRDQLNHQLIFPFGQPNYWYHRVDTNGTIINFVSYPSLNYIVHQHTDFTEIRKSLLFIHHVKVSWLDF